MAEAYRYQQQGAGNHPYPSHNQAYNPRHLLRTGTPPNTVRTPYNDTPSPSRSPDAQSPAHNIYGMYNQSHQHGQHGRVNGGTGGRGIPMMYNFQQHNPQQHNHAQHHQNMQLDHGAHTTNGAALVHHGGFSSGVLTNSTPSFAPNNTQNGHSATTRGGQAQQINEHWADQLKLHKESERAHTTMIDQHAPHHYARLKAGENRGIQSNATNTSPKRTQDGQAEDRGRPSNINTKIKRQDWHNMDLSGQGLRVLTSPLFNYTFLNELYIASNKLTSLPSSVGKLRELRHLDVSNNSLTVLPPELGMCVNLRNLLLFDNQIRTLPHELGALYQLEMLGIEGNPIDNTVKQEIMENGTRSLIRNLLESAPIPLPPAPRLLLDLQGGASVPANQERFRVLSYNILCDNYCTSNQYGYTPSAALSWDYRKEQVLLEIQIQDADFICLQEVDENNFNEYFLPKLSEANGYQGTFGQKTRARTMAAKDAKSVDGCATFYKKDKYILLDKQLIDFANIAINRSDMKNQTDIFNRVMPRDHIALITFFENIMTGSRVIIANAHMFWDPAYADVKLIQMAILMESVGKLAEKYARWAPLKRKEQYLPYSPAGSNTDDATQETKAVPLPSADYSSKTQVPLLVLGDLNSNVDSTVYALLAKGRIAKDHTELSSYQYGNFTRDGIEHPFSLRSAYSNVEGTPDALKFTNYTPGFTGHIDHIWYSTNALENTSLLGPVDEDYMNRVPGLPNYHFPSDHIALLAEFAVKGGRKEKKAIVDPDFGNSSRNRRD